jgi:dynein heavy chain
MMMVPDLRMISEIMLFSEGFESAKDLAKKMAVLYDLAKSVLSKQFHYDFGLRTLKTVLVLAGGLKRQYAELDERIVLMRVLRDSNMPKFTFEDVPLFMGMINDLFPGLECPRVQFESLSNALGDYFDTNGYRSDEEVFEFQVSALVPRVPLGRARRSQRYHSWPFEKRKKRKKKKALLWSHVL